jgi:hypothetical protein
MKNIVTAAEGEVHNLAKFGRAFFAAELDWNCFFVCASLLSVCVEMFI